MCSRRHHVRSSTPCTRTSWNAKKSPWLKFSSLERNSAHHHHAHTEHPRCIRQDILYIHPDENLPIVESSNGSQSASAVFEWTDGYLSAHLDTLEGEDGTVIPVMPLKRVKIPTDTVQLNIFEPRYRLMFRLVKRSRSRVFGVCLKTNTMGMATVGALCEMTHCITVPEKKSLFISARVIGRFSVDDVVHWKPFVALRVRRKSDLESRSRAAHEVEEDVWNDMILVRNMIDSLTDTGLSDDAFSLEVRRYSIDQRTRDSVIHPAGSHPEMLEASKRAGLMGNQDEMSVDINECTEFICSEAKATEEEREEWRREHFSFALARTFDFGEKELQQLLFMEKTEERLKHCHIKLQESMKYIIARKSLKDL